MQAKGQSIAEYVLAGGLVGLVALGGVMAVSNGLTGSMQGLSNRFGNSGGTATAGAIGGIGANVSGGVSSTTTAATTPTVTTSYPVSAAGFEQMMDDLPNLIETSGGSGTTKELMAYLSKLGQQLEADGELTPAQNNLLQNLSNAGHKIGEAQAFFEAHVKSFPEGTTVEDIKDIPIQFDGQTYSFSEMNNLYKIDPENSGSSYSLLDRPEKIVDYYTQVQQDGDWDYNGPLTQEFGKYLLEANDAGILNNNDVKQVVEGLSAVVVNTALVQKDGFLHYQDYGTLQERLNRVVDRASDKASRISHKSSVGICETGGGSDSGTLCGG